MIEQDPSHGLARADLIRAQVALISSTFVALIGQFMLSPWLVFQLENRGVTASMIGWFSAASWLGLLLTTPFATQLVRALGQRNALLWSLVIPLLTAIGITQTSHVLWWAGLSFLSGSAMSVRWIVAEACIAELSPSNRRGRIVSFYQTLLSVAFILAPSLLAWIKPINPNAPWVAIGFLAAGLALTGLIPQLKLADHSQEHAGFNGLIQAVRNNPAVVMAGFLGGIFELGISSLLPVYGLAMGFATGSAALLIAASGAGSMLVMMPVGEAADHISTRRISLFLVWLIFLTSLSALGVSNWPWLLWILAVFWGAGGGALYTVSMIGLGRVARGSALISATAVLVLSYTCGGLIGPIIAGSSLDLSLQWGFGLVTASISFCALLIIVRARQSQIARSA